MIDEKLLDRLDEEHEQLIQPSEFDKEMRRLARLGLWAEGHALPVLRENASRGHKLAIKALKALEVRG